MPVAVLLNLSQASQDLRLQSSKHSQSSGLTSAIDAAPGNEKPERMSRNLLRMAASFGSSAVACLNTTVATAPFRTICTAASDSSPTEAGVSACAPSTSPAKPPTQHKSSLLDSQICNPTCTALPPGHRPSTSSLITYLQLQISLVQIAAQLTSTCVLGV